MTGKRYEKYLGSLWEFKYDDSVTFLSEKKAKEKRFDMIFIDTSHTYEHTMNEMNIASQITNFMLMDDALFTGNATDRVQGGVKKAISDWFDLNKGWKLQEFWQGNTVLISKEIEVKKESQELVGVKIQRKGKSK
jgi:predicted O-methyltransferase YrrM